MAKGQTSLPMGTDTAETIDMGSHGDKENISGPMELSTMETSRMARSTARADGRKRTLP